MPEETQTKDLKKEKPSRILVFTRIRDGAYFTIKKPKLLQSEVKRNRSTFFTTSGRCKFKLFGGCDRF